MKIVFWNQTPPYNPCGGGIANYIQHRACILGEFEFDVWWANGESTARWSAEKRDWLERQTFPVSKIRRRLLGRWPALSPAWRSLVTRLHPDIFEIQAGLTSWLPFHPGDPRVVLHCHTSPLTRAFLNRDEGIERRMLRFKPWARRNFRKAHGILACSSEIAMLEAGYFRVHPDRITILPHAYSREAFDGLKRRDCGTSNGTFLVVGNVEYLKSLDLLARGFETYLEAGGKGRLLIAGCAGLHLLEGEASLEAIKSAVEHLTARYGSERVQFLGKVERRRLAELRSNATAIIMASRFESLSNVVGEAALSGCPLILSERTGWLRFAERYGAARLVNPYDPCDIATAMKEMEEPVVRSGYVRRGNALADFLTSPELAQRTAGYYFGISKQA